MEVIGNLDHMLRISTKDIDCEIGCLEDILKTELESNPDDKCIKYYYHFLTDGISQLWTEQFINDDYVGLHYIDFSKVMTLEYVLQRLAKLRPHIISTYQEIMWIGLWRFREEETSPDDYLKQRNTFDVRNHYQEVWCPRIGQSNE